MSKLEIKDLHVSVEENEILKGINLEINSNEIHALMGPNGSGKSTLSLAVMGHPKYKITQGEIFFDGQNILELKADKRAQLGLFLSFQYPSEVPGVKLSDFLRTSYNTVHSSEGKLSVMDFRGRLTNSLSDLKMKPEFADRYVNEGFSGGEKKRCEILQLAVLKPKLAILDETDSGLDIDALKIVADGVNYSKDNNNTGILIITHYQRILKYIQPDKVHVMIDGKIVKSGGKELAQHLEENGYEQIIKEVA